MTKKSVNLLKVIDDQLKLQVQISFHRHHQFILHYGLKRCKNVLDIGTGNGFFLYNMARENPEIMFNGLDNNIEHISLAKKLNINNINWLIGNLDKLVTLTDLHMFDGFLMRFLILHIPNAQKLLETIFSNAKSQAILWIIDLDLSKFSCHPTHEAFNMILGLVNRFCDKYSIDSRAGTNLPKLLSSVGFGNIAIHEDIWSNDNVDINSFKKSFLMKCIFIMNSSTTIIMMIKWNS